MVHSELLAKLLQAHPHLPRHVVERALDAMLDAITAGLAQGHRIELRNSAISTAGSARPAWAAIPGLVRLYL